MTENQVLDAYGARAAEYTDLFGSVEDMHEPAFAVMVVETRHAQGSRPHAAISAIARPLGAIP